MASGWKRVFAGEGLAGGSRRWRICEDFEARRSLNFKHRQVVIQRAKHRMVKSLPVRLRRQDLVRRPPLPKLRAHLHQSRRQFLHSLGLQGGSNFRAQMTDGAAGIVVPIAVKHSPSGIGKEKPHQVPMMCRTLAKGPEEFVCRRVSAQHVPALIEEQSWRRIETIQDPLQRCHGSCLHGGGAG